MRTPEFQKFSYLCPFEDRASVSSWATYMAQHGIKSDEVLFLCLPHELVLPVQTQFPQLRIISVEDIPQLSDCRHAAQKEIAQWEKSLITQAERSPFLWSILLQLHAEYLLLCVAYSLFAKRAVALSTLQQTWLLDHESIVYPNDMPRFGGHIPLLFLFLHEEIQSQRRSYRSSRFISVPALLRIQQGKAYINIGAWVLCTIVNRILGLWHSGRRVVSPRHARALKVVTCFRETQQATAKPSLHVDWLNFGGILSREKFILFGGKLLRLLFPKLPAVWIGRIDPRTRLSKWLFIMIFADSHSSFSLVWNSFKTVRAEITAIEKIFTDLMHSHLRPESSLYRYTHSIIWSWASEYLYADQWVHNLWRALQPQRMYYPNGYSILNRLIQWKATKENTGIEVPHGHPNRWFPRYYYRANQFVIPDRMNYRHMSLYGIDESRMVKSTSPTSKANVIQHFPEQKPPTIAIIYTGTYPYWAFPNFYQELHTMSVYLIRELTHLFPQATIILKSHPNGTSEEFFEGLRIACANEFNQYKIQHIPEGWACAQDFARIDLGISLVAHPSAPLVYFLELGIPLFIIPPGDQTERHWPYYPLMTTIADYPLFVTSADEAVIKAHELLYHPPAWQVASRQMQEYGTMLLQWNP